MRRQATKIVQLTLLLASLGPVSGCVGAPGIPPELDVDADRSVTFADLLASSDAYKGRTLILGGQVLSATMLRDGTRIEVLHLPLDNMMAPVTQLTTSQGRFLAVSHKPFDPATIPAGTRITVAGEVADRVTLALDGSEYTYPLLKVKTVVVWPRRRAAYWYIPYAVMTPGGMSGVH